MKRQLFTGLFIAISILFLIGVILYVGYKGVYEEKLLNSSSENEEIINKGEMSILEDGARSEIAPGPLLLCEAGMPSKNIPFCINPNTFLLEKHPIESAEECLTVEPRQIVNCVVYFSFDKGFNHCDVLSDQGKDIVKTCDSLYFAHLEVQNKLIERCGEDDGSEEYINCENDFFL